MDTENKTVVAQHQVNKKTRDGLGQCESIEKQENTRKRKIKEALIIQETKPETNKDPGVEIPPSMKVCCHMVTHGHVPIYNKLCTSADKGFERRPKFPVPPSFCVSGYYGLK